MSASELAASRREVFRTLDAFVTAFKTYAINADSAITNSALDNDTEVTGKRKRATKAPKDPNQPKRPASTFILYQIEKRAELKKQHPELNNQDLTQLISKSWAEMTETDKKPYVDRHAEADVKYKANMKDYKSSLDQVNGATDTPPPAKAAKEPVKGKAAGEKDKSSKKAVSKEIVEESGDDEEEDESLSSASNSDDSSESDDDDEQEKTPPPPAKKPKATPKAVVSKKRK